jgi:F0F1-type ATP synthase membrane subunit c/vacuolar-type H+-ATPase subunit K
MTRPATLSVAFAGAALVAAAAGLWAAYGQGVYLEALITGLAGCFG